MLAGSPRGISSTLGHIVSDPTHATYHQCKRYWDQSDARWTLFRRLLLCALASSARVLRAYQSFLSSQACICGEPSFLNDTVTLLFHVRRHIPCPDDLECEWPINQPFSEPLFHDLGATKNVTFLECCADQFYRLSPTEGPTRGQVPTSGAEIGNTTKPLELHLVAVSPTGGWQKVGRLRLLTTRVVAPDVLPKVELNGYALTPCANSSSLSVDPIDPCYIAALFNGEL